MNKLFGNYKKRNRSASMELSVNAIVILVMAMAVLGIGIVLIKGVLGSGKDKLMGALENFDLSEDASAEKPFTNIGNLQFRNNKENILMVGFYNSDLECDTGENIELNLICKDAEGTIADIDVASVGIDIPQGESGKIGALITPNDLQLNKNYACSIIAQCEDTTTEKDETTVFIKIVA
ncbi:MAG: hypothetical protein AB7V77_01155 [Candidatus Woesearchaeota archaeon]